MWRMDKARVPGPVSTLVLALARIGRACLETLAALGRFAQFTAQALLGLARPRPGLWGQQMLEIGFFSLPVVGLTAAFSGLVLVLQSYAGLADLASATLAETTTPRLVLTALVQELGPVLTGLMLAGRVGAAMAAELATLRVSEQIDALHTLSVNPIAYLVSPRLLAATLMLPLLVLLANLIGGGAAYILATTRLGLNPETYLQVTWQALSWADTRLGLTKAALFGFLIALISTAQGYFSAGGAAGVGRATRQAVVTASIAILASNYLLTDLFLAP